MRPDWLTRDGHLTDLSLERHLAGEIDVAAHLDGCALCRDRWAALEADEAAVVLRPPARVTPPTGNGGRLMLFGGLLAAAAAVVFFVLRPAGTVGDPIDDGVRLKGSFAFEVHAHDGSRSRQVLDGDAVAAGERLGFRVKTSAAGHLLVLGRDGSGETWLAWPQQGGGQSAPFGPAVSARDLGEAVRLDTTPGDERLQAVLCEAPVTQAQVAPLLARGETPPGCRLRALTVRKAP